MNEQHFDYTDDKRWTTPWLEEERRHVIEQAQTIPHGEARRRQLGRIALHLDFELEQRAKES
jgi:hypothetical protein